MNAHKADVDVDVQGSETSESESEDLAVDGEGEEEGEGKRALEQVGGEIEVQENTAGRTYVYIYVDWSAHVLRWEGALHDGCGAVGLADGVGAVVVAVMVIGVVAGTETETVLCGSCGWCWC